MKNILMLAMSVAIVTSCSSDDNFDNNQGSWGNRLVGTWESWKEVTDDGETYLMNENDCPELIEVYNANGSGIEAQYYFMENECQQLYSTSIGWSHVGGDTFQISYGGISANHQYRFEDDDTTMIQRDQESSSDIYFKKR